MNDANHPDVPLLSGVTSREGGAFWQAKTLAELAAEQGVNLFPDFDALLGQGKDLWADDAEFDAFLTDLRESRRGGG